MHSTTVWDTRAENSIILQTILRKVSLTESVPFCSSTVRAESIRVTAKLRVRHCRERPNPTACRGQPLLQNGPRTSQEEVRGLSSFVFKIKATSHHTCFT